MVDLSVKLGNLEMPNPVMPASGTFSPEMAQVIDINALGATMTKTVSRELRDGNPPPRVSEVECGMINCIGLPGKGLDYFLTELLPQYTQYIPPTIVSITSTTEEDFAAMAADCSVPGVQALEINISCPTRDPNGGNFALHADHTANTVRQVRAATDLPIIVKLSPNAGDVVSIAKAAEDAGADALTVANTILSMRIDTNSFRPSLGFKVGGMSGPAVKPIILRMVYHVAKAVSIPIIGCGGIVKAEDVVEYMLAGASAVQVGYASFRNPTAMISILEDLEKWCDKRGIARVTDLTGAVDDDLETDTYIAAAAGI